MFKILSTIFGSGHRFQILTCRNFSNHNKALLTDKTSKNNVKKPQSAIAIIRKIWLIRYMNFIQQYKSQIKQHYESNIGKRFPMKIMRVFNTGLKELYLDIKKYISIKKKKRQQGIQSLTRDELELSFKLPKELIKVSPVLIISAVPFTNYIVFPLIYFFPRVFLVSYFWTLQQKLDFFLYDYKRKLKYNKPVFRCLQAQQPAIQQSSLAIQWDSIIASIGSGTHPSPSDILACKELFTGNPFSLNSLKRNHVVCLKRIIFI